MKNHLTQVLNTIKTASQLGARQVGWFAVYQLGLRSGLFYRLTPISDFAPIRCTIFSPFQQPEKSHIRDLLKEYPELIEDLLLEADEICANNYRLFGGPAVPLELQGKNFGHHWTYYEGSPHKACVEDLKYIWEPARFGWVYPLGRAYLLTKNEKYPETFWTQFEIFYNANPPNQGPNWSSAQEVAFRINAIVFASSIFEHSVHTTSFRRSQMAGFIKAHAQRILVTLSYARAQNNNHLVSEALGLIAAGAALPEHPQAKHWKSLGLRTINKAFERQIRSDGTYTQHSTNYHRLMLQAALIAIAYKAQLSPHAMQRLAAATTWLLAQIDPTTGRVPNLGGNDGAYILPLAPGGYADYRPVAQAAARAFLGKPAFPQGPWDELGLWLQQDATTKSDILPSFPTSPTVYRLGDAYSWATLRAVQFRERPSHADQLHVDLWWQGENIALDAGTFRYTADISWNNSLADTLVHNTVTINHQDQMTRASRFLWLDWAQAKVLKAHTQNPNVMAAQHNGYRKSGITHRRSLNRVTKDYWQVKDDLFFEQAYRVDNGEETIVTVHWLLPDWPWELSENKLTLIHPAGQKMSLTISNTGQPLLSKATELPTLIRAGVTISGSIDPHPILGWYSPTYGQKKPALSFLLEICSKLPCTFISDWRLNIG